MGRWWRGQALVVARWRATGLRLRGRPPTPRSRARSRAPDGYRRSGERRPDTRAASKGALSAGARGSARVLLRSHVMAEWHARETAEQWDAHAGDRLPTRAEQQDVLLALLGAAEIGDGAVLDLGVGSGLVAEAVLVTLPKARLVGLDLSGAMLKLARERLGRFDARVELMQGDLASVDRIELPDLPYRAAFSVQTMHHLADAEKAAAIAWTANVVEPGGLIVIIDRVRVSERLFHDWAVLWRRIDSDTPATYAEHVAALTRAGDRPALLQDQLRWLQNVGLELRVFISTATARFWWLVGRPGSTRSSSHRSAARAASAGGPRTRAMIRLGHQAAAVADVGVRRADTVLMRSSCSGCR
jgi:tRNA (cmo5U34)-methyltransferase